MQLWFGGTSRILRINVVEGKAAGVDWFYKALIFQMHWSGKVMTYLFQSP